MSAAGPFRTGFARERRGAYLVRCLLLAVLFFLPGPPLSAQEAGGGPLALYGVVIDSESFAPIPGATVEVEGAGRSTITNHQGSFILPGLGPGEHILVARRLGYGEHRETVMAREGELVVVRVRPQPVALEEVAARGERSGGRTFVLPGVVLDHLSGLPVPGASVEIEGIRRAVFTDSLGRFAFPGLPEGAHTVTTRRLGYVEHVETSELAPGNLLIVEMWPRPAILEGVTAIASRFRYRQNSAGVRAYTADGLELTVSSASSLSQFFQDRFQLSREPCRGDEGGEQYCLKVRGYAAPMTVYLDGFKMPGGVTVLDHFAPGDMYRVELYPMLRQIHLFTPHYIEWLASTGGSLPGLCIVC